MKKVWAVEQGSYSDYHVIGVFSTKANAQRIADLFKDSYDSPTVAEWALDPAIAELNAGMLQYDVLMLVDGTVERIATIETSAYDLEGRVYVWPRTQAAAYKGTGTPDALQVRTWAKDQGHAIKIANEHRARLIASGEFK